jgi:hypothetical protein
VRELVETRARGRCEDCHAPQAICGYRFHLEHIHPAAQGGSDAPINRSLACASCNLAKGDRSSGIDPQTKARVAFFNPRTDVWEEHFAWGDDHQTLLGLTAIGRVTIAALAMNDSLRMEARRLWHAAAWLP